MNLNIFNTTNLFEAATNLFQQLNIKLNSNTAEPLPTKDILKHHYKDNDTFKAIDKTYFIGIIDDSVFKATGMFDINYSYKEAIEQGDKNYNGLMLFALELKKQPTRTEISELTRAFNRISQKMPVALVLKYTVAKEAVISIAISERFKYLQNWRQGEKAGKVIILRDIHTQNTHAGHTRILQDLVKPVGVSTYEQLHQHWLQVLDVSILNKKFFQELSNWYFSAMNEVSFPDDKEKNKEIRNATNLIRLITRIIFIWFIKEKQLVPASLFRKDFVAGILKDFNKNKQSHNYYNAILQNLFFATLNQKMDERKFAKEGDLNTNKEEYGVKNLFRYADLFNIPEKEVLALFKDVPFLNGGLFDCLDKPNDDGKIEYVDGFSRNPKKQATVPDYIFFGEEKEVDLNDVYGTKNKRYSSRGLINLLESYKFTVAENTPIEEEIALDPELLGKVFENLLASYNPETQTTARKQTGSFYTPREIVNYMVEESLLEYLKQNVKNDSKDFETRLRDVFSYSENPNPFSEAETKALIEALHNCKILDPACGSGAFPMGILHKMVHILQKLDPENKLWKDLQRNKAIEETEAAFNIGDKEERAKRLAEINDVFENNASDYGRKLYLIENCIYGIDIQPIAVQIAKLRFFISLVIDQKVDKSKENFGVRSLPNLETKFVAANTLIGLDKPQQTLLRNPDIEVKENELKELRHKYFTANTRKEKIALQKQDKKLRLEIAKMLESDGWETKVAKQIVAFDPYDQNTFADWFDPEWMFGLTTGFDIVIGNPPYIQLQKDGGKLAKEYEKQGFKTFDRMGDIYSLFYEKGLQLLKNNGILTYITSNKWMRAGYGKSTRAFFCKHRPLKLIDLGSGVFESATVDTNILVIQKTTQTPQSYALNALDLSKEKELTSFDNYADKWVTLTQLSADSWTIANDIEQRIKAKIEHIGKPLKEWDINIYRGILTGYNDAFIIDGKKKDELIAQDPKSAEIIKPILRGRDIKRYKAEFADLWLIATFPALKLNIDDYPAVRDYLKSFGKRLEQTGEEFIDENGQKVKTRKKTGNKWFETQDQIGYHQEFEKEKIVWAETDQALNTCIVDAGIYLQKTCFMIITNQTKLFNGLLNSNLCQWYIRRKSPNLGEKGLSLTKETVHEIPISSKILSHNHCQETISDLVSKIILFKEQGKDTTALEKQIDNLVYKLYELTYEELKVIDPAFPLSKEAYERIKLE
ncbi:MAG: hypothetical protein PWR20_2168 [Bacteroidales bacterium]|jgi:hypothetical protein|nr:hypothetical protein [Bacteroidales bacterium]